MNNISQSRLGILRALDSSPRSWTSLRVEHFGSERAASNASTSYNNLLGRMIKAGQISKQDGMYHITESGRRLVSTMQGVSEGCVHNILDPYGRCLRCKTIV